MDLENAHKPLDLSYDFIKNINRIVSANDGETQNNAYTNSHINPPFRYYNDDTNLNLTPQLVPSYTYKNKTFFAADKPIQTEHDEIGINEGFLKSYYGPVDYGTYQIANQSLPERLQHKITPKENIYELF